MKKAENESLYLAILLDSQVDKKQIEELVKENTALRIKIQTGSPDIAILNRQIGDLTAEVEWLREVHCHILTWYLLVEKQHCFSQNISLVYWRNKND